MLIVAYLYNTNGMASWCWEAAHALYEAQQPVVLVCSQAVQLPEDSPVRIIRFDPPIPNRGGLAYKISQELRRLSPQSSGFVWELHQHLEQQGINPTVYLLNQTDLQDPRVSVPQYVTGWAYPTSFSGYASKIGTYMGWKLSRNAVRSALSTLGWWGKDRRAYRSATGVLAVSQRLNADLVAQGVKSVVVHPGTALSVEPRLQVVKPPYNILTVALDLEEPRKRVRWLVEALQKMPDPMQFSLTLVGKASPAFQEWVCRDGFPATFAGSMTRAEVQAFMVQQDLFLFGSALDDWGYVLTEAMSQNLCIVAPNLSPFDEIVGDTGILYAPNSQDDLRHRLSNLMEMDISALRLAARSRVETMFSRQVFAQNLLAVAKADEASSYL